LFEPVGADEFAQYALILRHTKCYDGRKSLSICSVLVQSEPLKTFLGKVLDGYPGVTTSLERLEFHQPFRPLVHRWESLVKAREEEELNSTAKEHVDHLLKIFEGELKDTLERKKDLIRNGVITPTLVWILFEPGDMVISNSNTPRGYLFSSAQLRGGSNEWVLTCKHIDFDGIRFGDKEQQFFVDAFIGTMPITSLPVYPLKYHTVKDDVRKTLIAQGKRWEEHKWYHYRQYEGTASENPGSGFMKRYHVTSRIIIDAEAFGIFSSHGPI
jgi:hypothetical protein